MAAYEYYTEADVEEGLDPLVWRWDGNRLEVETDDGEWCASAFLTLDELINDSDEVFEVKRLER
jgi:hypothetical protein